MANRKNTSLVPLILLFCAPLLLSSQNSDFKRVYDILQTNCTSSTCHGGAHPLDLNGSETAVYNALINQTPINPTAAANGNLLVDPGHPYNSYLLRKVGADFDNYFDLQAAEGSRMPSNGAPALQDEEIEVIRQWIMYGAEENSNRMDSALVHDYYNGNQSLPFLTTPPAPNPSEGFQIRLGPIFLGPIDRQLPPKGKDRTCQRNLFPSMNARSAMCWTGWAMPGRYWS